jgi:hypothetical protein
MRVPGDDTSAGASPLANVLGARVAEGWSGLRRGRAVWRRRRPGLAGLCSGPVLLAPGHGGVPERATLAFAPVAGPDGEVLRRDYALPHVATAQRSPTRWNSAGTARAPLEAVRQGDAVLAVHAPLLIQFGGTSWPERQLAYRDSGDLAWRRHCEAVWWRYRGAGAAGAARPCRGPVAPDPGDMSRAVCSDDAQETERRREQHPALVPCRPAAPRLQMGGRPPSILRRLAFVHWRCRYGRSVCSTAGPATTR